MNVRNWPRKQSLKLNNGCNLKNRDGSYLRGK
jgi:hypothetical protein